MGFQFHSFLLSNNQISHHFSVPDNQNSIYFGVPDNQIQLHLDSPDNCLLTSSGGVSSIRSQAKVSTPKIEEHWGSLHTLRSTTLLYNVHCKLYTVCFPNTNFTTIVPAVFPQNLKAKFSTYFSKKNFIQFFTNFFKKNFTQFFHLTFPTIFSTQFINHSRFRGSVNCGAPSI